jgi:hypothetical protein
VPSGREHEKISLDVLNMKKLHLTSPNFVHMKFFHLTENRGAMARFLSGRIRAKARGSARGICARPGIAARAESYKKRCPLILRTIRIAEFASRGW